MLLGYKDAENEDVNIAEVALELEERWENVVRNVRDRNNQFEGHGDEEFCVRLHKTLVHELTDDCHRRSDRLRPTVQHGTSWIEVVKNYITWKRKRWV